MPLVAVCLVVSGSLGGCMGDPEPDASVAPVEINAENCVLNRTSVAVGTHSVSVIGAGSAELRDAAGRPVPGAPSRDEAVDLVLPAGVYEIICGPDHGELARAVLTVTAAP